MELVSVGLSNMMGNVNLKHLPTQQENLDIWTPFNSGIIETGLGVSQWTDVSGLDHHIKQGVDLDRPQKQADGSILFDGIRQYLRADAFTSNQPTTIYLLCKQVTWTGSDRFYDGNSNNTGLLQQFTATPQLRIFAGGVVGNISLTLDTYGIISVVFNGVSSLIQLNNEAPVTGDAGASNMGGFTLGAGGGFTDFSNIQVKELVKFSAAHDAAQLAININRLATVGGLSI